MYWTIRALMFASCLTMLTACGGSKSVRPTKPPDDLAAELAKPERFDCPEADKVRPGGLSLPTGPHMDAMREDDGDIIAAYGEVASQLNRLIDCVNAWRDRKPQ